MGNWRENTRNLMYWCGDEPQICIRCDRLDPQDEYDDGGVCTVCVRAIEEDEHWRR